jgi:hypothetical protein
MSRHINNDSSPDLIGKLVDKTFEEYEKASNFDDYYCNEDGEITQGDGVVTQAGTVKTYQYIGNSIPRFALYKGMTLKAAEEKIRQKFAGVAFKSFKEIGGNV